jgi:hypothetical protein
LDSEKVLILNRCKKLPLGAIWHVRHCLHWINPNHLTGIQYIELIDKLPAVSQASPEWYKEARKAKRGINAWYNEETKTDSAGIVLHMPDLCYGIPNFLWWTPAPTLLITKVLAHEVAHHLRYTRGYIFSRNEVIKRDWQEEGAADRYAFDLRREMVKKWSYWLGHEIISITADVYYRKGVKRWEERNYKKAASYWNKARIINSDHTYAAHWYRRAVEMCQSSEVLGDEKV